MPAFALSGRLSAIVFFVALPAVIPARPPVTKAPPSPESAASASANTNSSVSIQKSPPTLTDEQWGDSLMARKEYQAAIDAYSRILQPSATVWNQMGIAYQMLFDEKNAVRCYKECLRRDPYNPHALNNLATIEDEQGNYGAAERLYRQAIELSPGSARLIRNAATNLLLQHKFSQSSEAYAQALALDPHILDRQTGPTADATSTPRDRGQLSYLQARSCARAGLIECAIDHLRGAFNEGFATPKQVVREDDFTALRRTPEYERLIEEQR
jgi:tetratricopeptide (TPR) repeat protein